MNYVIVNGRTHKIIGYIKNPTKRDKTYLETLCWTRELEFKIVNQYVLLGVRYSDNMYRLIAMENKIRG